MTALSIVTVSHRSHRHLPAYVESFLTAHARTAPDSIEFVLVENSGASDIDRLLDPLRAAGFGVTFVETGNNGFGAGCNAGAAEAKGDTLIFANPDIVFVDRIDAIAADQDGTMWGTVAQCDTSGLIYGFDVLPEYKTVIGEFRRAYRRFTPIPAGWERRVYPVGSFLIVASSLFRQAGGFDERFFMYHEEAELARRLHQIAPPPTYFGDIRVSHEAFGSAQGRDAVLRHETRGLLTYADVTGKRRVLATRFLTQLLLSAVSSTARRRLRFLIGALVGE
ncbi:glycosyltransferase [Sphingomonas sp. IC-56]|uniref:glycosyltransferase n=1 Tax=Sphingomonas sp. IC-56 TaxID=2898529 RepID=UPI001E40A9C0|nr:glycosyltransferase [Sphingomonas sp. IC-56]MCD2323311.1 glycosyltransferase [Sphingomonas sp. IC-56]